MRVGLARACFGIQHLVALGVFAQAVLAGLFLYLRRELREVHLLVANVLVLLALLLVFMTLAARFNRRHRLGILAGAQLGLLALQYYLGLAGATSPLAAALHVPAAFVVFVVAMLWLVRARRAMKESM